MELPRLGLILGLENSDRAVQNITVLEEGFLSVSGTLKSVAQSQNIEMLFSGEPDVEDVKELIST